MTYLALLGTVFENSHLEKQNYLSASITYLAQLRIWEEQIAQAGILYSKLRICSFHKPFKRNILACHYQRMF
jgi:hypothetical protein